MDIFDLYKRCRLCPRACGTDRLSSPAAGGRAAGGGYCGETAELRLAFAGLHLGEEPPLSGKGGSGTIFVTGCNLGCSFCQNRQISQGAERLGRPVSPEEFASICIALQNKGAENINIVTGSHAVPALVLGLNAAKAVGLRIPVLWNSSAYESPETLELLGGIVDVWLPDLKTLDSSLAAEFFNAPDYPQAVAQAILWMMRHCNRPGRQNVPGVIVRHLILPGHLDSTRAMLRWFADNAAGAGAFLSLMSQYTPITGAEGGAPRGPGCFVNQREYETVLGWLEEFGIEDGFCQELVTGSDWLPDFSRLNPFSSELSVPVWHWEMPKGMRRVKRV
jgi:putative pyruvate formate lyase activating enzyme